MLKAYNLKGCKLLSSSGALIATFDAREASELTKQAGFAGGSSIGLGGQYYSIATAFVPVGGYEQGSFSVQIENKKFIIVTASEKIAKFGRGNLQTKGRAKEYILSLQ